MEKTQTLEVSVKPKSKFPGIDKSDPKRWIVRIKEMAIEGRANEAVQEALAREFGIPKSSVEIILGKKSKNKVIRLHLK